MFKGWFDPCPLVPKDELVSNGLNIDWWDKRHIYVNPPYSEPHLWVEKALNELFKANMEGKPYTCVMLLDSSTRWFRALHGFQNGYHFKQGRRLNPTPASCFSFSLR